MDVLSPYKEAIDVILEAGGDPLKLCYQCGLCTGTCPWNTVRSFMVRRIMHEAQLGATDFAGEDAWICVTCRACVQRCPRGVEIIDVMRAVRRAIVSLGIGVIPVAGHEKNEDQRKRDQDLFRHRFLNRTGYFLNLQMQT